MSTVRTSTPRVRPGERILVIGTSAMAQRLVQAVDEYLTGCVIAGIVTDTPDPAWPPEQERIVGSLDTIGAVIRRTRPHRIVVGLADRRGRLPVKELLETRVSGVLVQDAVEAYEQLTGKLALEAITPGSLILTSGFRRTRATAFAQRALALFAAVLGLVLTAPLLVLIALAIKIDSRGPVLFRQSRIGAGGRPFELLKFRTMRPAAQYASEWALDNKDRVTRVGRLLRALRLDELPQLINIARGDMHLVGPRPHPVSNETLFLTHIPYYALRASVRPGLTGWAQVRYRYANNLEEETEKMRFDLYYIKHMSIWLDIRILLLTTLMMLTGYRRLADGSGRARKPFWLWPSPAGR